MKFKNPLKAVKEKFRRRKLLQQLCKNTHKVRESIGYTLKLLDYDPEIKNKETKKALAVFGAYYVAEKKFHEDRTRFDKLILLSLGSSFKPEDKWARNSAIILLGEMKDEDSIGYLSSLLWNQNNEFGVDDEIVKNAIRTLGKIKGEEVILMLMTLLRTKKYPQFETEIENALAKCTEKYSKYKSSVYG